MKEPQRESGEEDEKSTRDKINDFLESKIVVALLGFFTLFALVAGYIRLWLFSEGADPYFFVGYIIALILFSLEILLTCLVDQGYKYSFFFWLDILATLSLIPDINWISSPMMKLFGFPSFETYADATDANESSLGSDIASQAARILRSFRLIRLIRIVKLYQFCMESNSEEAALFREQQKNSANAQEAALKKELEPSLLGNALSDISTKKVLVGILLMFITYPFFTFSEAEKMTVWGLQMLFWYGRSSCELINGEFMCEDEWVTKAGWNQLLIDYIENPDPTTTKLREVVWLRVPDFERGGIMSDVKNITNAAGEVVWEEKSSCAGKLVSEKDDCPLRIMELEIIYYRPDKCGSGSDCDNLVSYARIDRKEIVQETAARDFFSILFTTILLFLAAINISSDTKRLVIRPITKMVDIIKTLADDPLKRPKKPALLEESQVEQSSSRLENTVYKIGYLLQVGYGRLGAQIIRENMRNDGELNIMVPGVKINVIFLLVRIHDFTEITDCLQGNMLPFVNKISLIVHSTAHQWEGFANKNFGELFLITWLLNTNEDDQHLLTPDNSILGVKAFITAVKIMSEIRRDGDLKAFSVNKNIRNKLGIMYDFKISFSLHVGWAIQGSIGSDEKIDAGYLSPHLGIASRLENIATELRLPLIFSENFYNLLSLTAKQTIRKLDVILSTEIKEAMGIYTFDVNNDTVVATDDHEIGEMIRQPEFEKVNLDNMSNKGSVDYMFTLDADITSLQIIENKEEFNTAYRAAFELYSAGDFVGGFEGFEKCIDLWSSDGPSQQIMEFIQMNDFRPPDDWMGARNLDADMNTQMDAQGHNQGDAMSGEYIEGDELPSVSSAG